MPKAKAKKKTDVKATLTKSVFLYCAKPNVDKLNYLKDLQKDYNDAINFFIDLLSSTDEYVFELLGNKKKDSIIRELEKANRVKSLKSALSQTAFDDAFTMLSNRIKNIKIEIYKVCKSIFSSSNILFAAVVNGYDKDWMTQKLTEVKNSYKDANKIEFYEKLIAELENMSDEEFEFQTAEVFDYYCMFSAVYKIPEVKHSPVRLDSRVQNFDALEKAENISVPYVLSVIDVRNNKGERIEIPLTTSRNSERRVEQYEVASTVSYTITDKNQVKVIVPFEKKVTLEEPTNFIGVDTGITDALYASNGTKFGSFNDVIADYDKNVLPLLGEMNKLREKKQKLKKILKRNLPDDVKKNIIAKIDRIETNIKSCKKLQRELNKYQAAQNKLIKDTVNSYIANIPSKNTVTVLELLDIKEFNKSRKLNRNLSNFARGQLQKTLMESLNWRGYTFMEVEPAYTSQVCPICFNLDSKNRDDKDKKNFTCTCCGYHDDADHVGSLNIVTRATDVFIANICENHHGNARQAKLREYYKAKHEDYLKSIETESEAA